MTILYGNLGAIPQTNIKRMLAYSTISQMGFMLLGLLSGVFEGSTPEAAASAYSSSMFYIVTYVLTTFGVDSIDPAFMATKKVYRAGSRQAAVAFLRTQVVTETLTYIEVETPDGPFGIDLRHRVFNAQGHFVDF